MHDLERQKHPLHGLYKRSKIGIVCARTGEKHLPSIRTLQLEFITAWEEGKIVLNKHSRDNHYEEPTREKGEWTIHNVDSLMRRIADYYTLCLPIQYSKIDLFNENLGVDILFMPAKFIHMVQILTMAGQGIQNTWKHAMFIKSLKYIPNWHKADPKMFLADYWWEHLRTQKATAVDEDHGCTWCKEKGHPMEQGYMHFHKGDLVAREHFSAQDFTTLHLTCALEKLNILRDELDKGPRNR